MGQVLMLSNDPVLRKKNLDVLEASGLQVTEVTEGLDGLLMVDKNGFEIIIIDEELPDIDGYRACQKMRQYSDLPIILLGTEQSEEVWAKVEELGFDIYLKKPVSPRELVAHVRSLLRRSIPVAKVNNVAGDRKPDQRPATTPPPISPPLASSPPVEVGVGNHELMFQKRKLMDSKPISVAPITQDNRLTTSTEGIRQAFQDLMPAEKPAVDVVKRQEIKTPIDPKEKVHVAHRFQTGLFYPQNGPLPAEISNQKTISDSYIKPQQPATSQNMPIHQVQDWVTERQAAKPLSFNSKNISVAPLQETGSVYLQSVAKPQNITFPTPAPAYDIWKDSRVVKLMEALSSNKLGEIRPIVNVAVKGGFAFPEADRIMETTGEQTKNVLDALADQDILERMPFEKVNVDPEGSFQLVPVERCPKCGGGNLSRGQLIEHFFCGNVGLDLDYKDEHKYTCPKCKRELKLLGTDYRNAGLQCRCLDCSEIFPTPVLKWRNLQTGKLWSPDELTAMQLFSYRLRDNKREWLEFQLKPKAQLIELLKLRGYVVQESAQIPGSSGALHTIDILASKDDGLAKMVVGIGILACKMGENEVSLDELFKFDTKAYDVGLNYKVVIVLPRLTQEAMKFAERQKIGVFEAVDPGTLIAFLENKANAVVPPLTPEKIRYLLAEIDMAGQQAQPAQKLSVYLRAHGYNVVENAKIIGKSGAEHIFDIFAQRDDVVIKPAVAIAISYAEDRTEVDIGKVTQFDAEVFDAGIRNKIFVAIPQLSVQGKQFAKQQRIKVMDGPELDQLISSIMRYNR